MITSERTGGAEGFVDHFRRAGLGDVITSWYGGKEGKPLTSSHLDAALGTNALDKLSSASGLTRSVVTSALTFLLPKVIGLLTPTGVLPSNAAVRSQVSAYLEHPDTTAVKHERERGWPGWLPWAVAAAV